MDKWNHLSLSNSAFSNWQNSKVSHEIMKCIVLFLAQLNHDFQGYIYNN